MKKAILMSSLALICGLVLGCLVGQSVLPSVQSQSVQADLTPAALPVGHTARGGVSPAQPSLNRSDNTLLLERAGQVLEALKAQDYTALAQLVHPQRGVTLTPYSTVDPARDNVLTPSGVAGLTASQEVSIWGLYDGSGNPIRCTGAEYFNRYVFNADYTRAPRVGIDTVLISGNALENVAAAYPDGRFVEYHFPGIDPNLEGFDWCSLKLVFEVWDNDWYLVGLIHGEWTI